MTEFVTIFGVVTCVLCGVVAYSLYKGVHGNLENAKVGEVYHFDYLQPVTGDAQRFMVKIISNVPMTAEQIAKLNNTSRYRRYDSIFVRTPHLVTGQSPDGKIRNFYAERTVNCKRTPVGRLVFNMGLANMMF
jgi:hypothetical protein